MPSLPRLRPPNCPTSTVCIRAESAKWAERPEKWHDWPPYSITCNMSRTQGTAEGTTAGPRRHSARLCGLLPAAVCCVWYYWSTLGF
jgi:hypothetical protein